MAKEAAAGSRILRALATIDELQETIGKHDKILTRLADRLTILADRLAETDKRLAVIEKAKQP